VRNRPFLGARIEKQFNRRIGTTMRRLGWKDAVVAYTGYGSQSRLRVLARVIVTADPAVASSSGREEVWLSRRGWRNFFTLPGVNRAVQVSVGGRVTDALTDRDGYVDITVARHGLAPGWHHVGIRAGDSEPTEAPVLIIGDDVRFGIISDIDDTIITTYLPRPMLAAYNSLVLAESARVPVTGMSAMYATILRQHPGAPLLYLSTGSWSTQPFLERFIARHGYPAGPMLLTNWGPTNTGWFRSGPDHKRITLAALARDFPQVRWLLVGDDGQHDPAIYAEFAIKHPPNVAGIALRELASMELLLARGAPTGQPELYRPAPVPLVRAPDGYMLTPLVQQMLRASCQGLSEGD
jgi:phosphatidate phosphatase APP1